MQKKTSPMDQLLARVQSWCGVVVDRSRPVVSVRIKDKVIARFPSVDSVEVVLCGSIKKQIKEEPWSLPLGVWSDAGDSNLLVDLGTPAGFEEAIRSLLNAYIVSQSPEARDWWMSDSHINEDPTCEKIAQVIRSHRKREAPERAAAAG